MCNDYANHVTYSEYLDAMRQVGMPIRLPLAPPNLEPRDDIWPKEIAPVFRRYEDGVEMTRMAWGFEPPNPKGRAVINFKSEGRSFANSRRCLVPASHFYEFKGDKPPKSKFKFTLSGEPWFCFAGLWSPAKSDLGETFTLLTIAPGLDVAPIHDRQMVVLRRDDWKAWLDLTKTEADLLSPPPAGSLEAEQVR